MIRRHFLFGAAGALAGVAASQRSASAQTVQFHELRTYELRNDLDAARMHDFMQKHLVPEMKKHSLGPIGAFNVISGQNSPALILLLNYRSLNGIRTNTQMVDANSDYSKAWRAFEKGGQIPYVRYKSQLMRAFSGHPQVELPTKREGNHLFELRTYESRDSFDSAAKIDMFNEEEIQIFRDCGFKPIFFGESIFGNRLPNLTYLVAFDDMAQREKAWAEFRVNPDWNRIKDEPRWADTVTNIHASFLQPTPYSEIR